MVNIGIHAQPILFPTGEVALDIRSVDILTKEKISRDVERKMVQQAASC